MKDIKAEKVVIGSLILYPDLLIDAIELIDYEAFTVIEHQELFKAIQVLFDNGKAISNGTIEHQYQKETGRKVDTLNYLDTATGNGFVEHCLIVKEKHLARLQGALAVELSSKSNDPKQDPLDTNEFLITEAEKLSNQVTISNPVTNKELIDNVTRKIELAGESQGLTGVRTGFNDLDRIYGGRQKTDLIIKAARPAMGKTAQALCEAKAMAFDDNKRVLFFSLEMGAEQLMQRLVSIHTSIPLNDLRKGTMNTKQWDTYNEEVNHLTKDNLIIVDDVYTLVGIKTTAKKYKLRGNIDAIYIDYLQLIEHRVGGRSKENEVSEISRSLKMLAKQLDVPVIALSQLSRAVETRGGSKKPQLSDLRDSGAIEQDADIVEFIYRPEYYNPDEVEYQNKAYVIIAKNRNGSCADVEFFFNKECTRFENVVNEYTVSKMPMNEEFDAPF